MNIVSVVIPIYNVEDYLEECIDSVLNQTYTELEIILVDDGSKDNSLEICKKKEQEDSRIIVISKENGGLSSARNAGIDRAKGEYICFIDSDDWIEADYVELLMEGIVDYNADISVIHMTKVSDFSKIKFQTQNSETWTQFTKESAMKELFTNNFIGYSANNKLYKTSLFKTIRYPYGLLMEDKATTYRLIDESTKIVVNPSTKYHYFLRDNSILRSKFNVKSFDSFQIHEEILLFIDSNYPGLSTKVRTRYVYESIRMMMRMIESNHDNEKDFDKCIEIIVKYKKDVLTDKELSFGIKGLTILLSGVKRLPYKLSKRKMSAKLLRKMEGMK
ncbi:hypothetical protein A5819_000433 [Enterococcus sp. 7E2_DIV0204]|uniref:glycosyltransferase family 2 protein n=1 Tax=unclassified Enterococcus TaxID=2608891 RepID=UPI000A354909|nr:MULTISPECIES: glycosyltransferase family 2 protein [unclassified Enterococcus]OTN87983.1 hypothetical protein A5819_000433 [Enterococcus sp. 7E2_DIV0204]OTP49341.1 hypothetical protein A5884_002537 [Enterococcus sp. 7D2_DIV0200]